MELVQTLINGYWYIGYLAAIMVISTYVRRKGFLLPLFRYIGNNIKSKRAIVALISCISGVLPIPGRVSVSAGILDTIAPRDDRRKIFGIIDYFSTHHYYFWSPLEKTVILPMAVLEISYLTFIGHIWLLLATAIAMILYYLIFILKEDDIAIEIHDSEPTIEDKWINWSVIFWVTAVILIGNLLKLYGNEFTDWVGGSESIVTGLLFSFILAFVLGSSGKFGGITALMTSIFGLKYLSIFFAVDYAGYMLSPTHKCTHIGRGYFHTDIKQFYNAVIIFVSLIILTAVFSTIL